MARRARDEQIDGLTDEQYREAAKRLHEREGELEIDENAVVSRGGDPGAYVQAWVWVYDKDAVREEAG